MSPNNIDVTFILADTSPLTLHIRACCDLYPRISYGVVLANLVTTYSVELITNSNNSNVILSGHMCDRHASDYCPFQSVHIKALDTTYFLPIGPATYDENLF